MADATNTAAEPSFREQVEKAEAKDQAAQAEQAPPEPQEAVGEAQEPAKPAEPEPPKTVPLEALHEARRMLKAERQAAAQARQQAEAFQRQQIEIMQYLAAQQGQAQQPQVPAFDADPLRNIHATQTQTQAQLQALAQRLEQGQQQTYQQEREALAEYQFRTAAQQADAEFQARQPDAADGIQYLKKQRTAQYEAMGMDRAQAQQRMLQDERDLVAYCFQNGENPAERAYEMAKQAGYVAAAAKMKMQQEGKAASLPTQGSGAGGGRLSLDALSKLRGKDFLDATSGGKWKQMMRDR